MAEEANSRETVPTLRWAETAAEVPDANIVEPSGGVKDVGWIPGVSTASPGWFNWLSWAAGVFNRYVENLFGLGLTRNHVMAGCASTEGEVAAGVGLNLTVAAARVWIGGKMYAMPSATVSLDAADPTNPRIDLVVCRLLGSPGVPTAVAITGTPAASPAAPTASSTTDCPLYEARVNAAALVPTSLTDVREFGAVRLDTVLADTLFEAGELGGSGSGKVLKVQGGSVRSVRIDALSTTVANGPLNVTGAGVAGGLTVTGGSSVAFSTIDDFVVDASGTVSIDAVNSVTIESDFAVLIESPAIALTGAVVIDGAVTVDPEDFTLAGGITRKLDIPFAAFQSVSGTPDVEFVGDVVAWRLLGPSAGATLLAPVRIPNGATITAVRVRGSKDNIDGSAAFTFYSASKTTNNNVFTETDSDTGSTGAYVLAATGLSHVVDQGECYFLSIGLTCGASGDEIYLWNAEVEYTETNPFNGL